LGAHIVGPYAKEQINIFALAIQRGITSEDLKEIILHILLAHQISPTCWRLIMSESP